MRGLALLSISLGTRHSGMTVVPGPQAARDALRAQGRWCRGDGDGKRGYDRRPSHRREDVLQALRTRPDCHAVGSVYLEGFANVTMGRWTMTGLIPFQLDEAA